MNDNNNYANALNDFLHHTVALIKWFYYQDNLAEWLWTTTAQLAKPCVAVYVAGEVCGSYLKQINDLSPNYLRVLQQKLWTKKSAELVSAQE